jgi:DNA-binding SARP family transcriptional activator
VITLLNRMRRTQQRRRPEGLRIKLPEGDLWALEQGLRVAADMPLLDNLGSALRRLRDATTRIGSEPPAIVAVRCQEDAVEFVLESGSKGGPAPLPFRASDDGSAWIISGHRFRDEERCQGVDELRDGVALPALVTVGADETSTVLVNLEQVGSLSVSGCDASMMLQGIVVELCTLPWSDGVDVVVVGHHGELRSLERARRAVSVTAVVHDVRRHVRSQRALAAESGARHPSEARWAGNDACWDPLVIVCFPEAAETEPEAVQRLLELAGGGSDGVAVIIGAPALNARWSVVVDGGPVVIKSPAGSAETPAGESSLLSNAGELRPQPVPPDLLGKVDALVESADAAVPAWYRKVDDRVPVPNGRTDRPAVVDGRYAEEPEICVLVLGPVQVVGAERPSFSRVWALDLIVFLAVHPEGASTERWAAALWPDRVMASPSLHSTASAARRALGVSRTGEDHLPRARGRLKLGPGVTSDWAQFQKLAATDDPADWEAALALIRGQPFQELRSSDWVVLDGTQATIESAVVDLACRCARYFLDHGEPEPARAELAARRALLVSPYDERLYRTLLVAADAAGNPAGVERAWDDLVQVVAEDVEPYDAIHPETVQLYRRLSRRGRSGRGASA